MILFFYSRGKTQDNLFFRNVCKYTDFFVLFTVSAFRVEGNFYFSFFPGANGSFVIIGCCTSTSRFHIFNQQVLGPCVFEIEGMGYRFTLGDVTEVPGLLYPFHPGVGWRNGRILFFFTRKNKKFVSSSSIKKSGVLRSNFFL